MTGFLLSLDEIARVKRRNGIASNVELARVSGLARNTWTTAMKTRRPTPQVLDALAALGAQPNRVLILDEIAA